MRRSRAASSSSPASRPASASRESPCGLIPGIGPKTAERLRHSGLDTLAKLAAASPEQLAARFGSRFGAALQSRARFEDDTPVTEERKVVSESRETTFDYDIADPAALEQVMERLAEQLCSTLVRQERQGRTIGIKVRLDDFSTHTRARTLAEPVASMDRVLPVALDLLRRFAAPRPVRLLGVRVAGLEPGPGHGRGAAHARAVGQAGGGSVQGAGQAPARVARQRVLDAELVQDADDDAADVVLGAVRRGQGADEEIQRALLITGVQRRERVAQVLGGIARSRARSAPPGRRRRSCRAPAARMASAPSRSPRPCRSRASGTAASARDGSSSTARRSDSSSPRATSSSASEGSSESRKLSTAAGGWAPTNSATICAVAERLDGGDALDGEGARHLWVGVHVDLGQLDLALAGGDGALEHRPELPAGAAPFGPEVDDDGNRARALDDG